jgi:hypothetical protein
MKDIKTASHKQKQSPLTKKSSSNTFQHTDSIFYYNTIYCSVGSTAAVPSNGTVNAIVHTDSKKTLFTTNTL